MRTPVILFLVAAAIHLVAPPVTAESTPMTVAEAAAHSTAGGGRAEIQGRPPAAWSVDAVAGLVTDDPADDLVGAMRASGFGDDRCGFWCDHYPTKASSLVHSFWLAVRHRLGTGAIHAGLAGGTTEFPNVKGHHLSTETDPATSFFLNSSSKVDLLAAMVWWEVVPGFWNWAARIGAGPSINRASVEFGDSGAPDDGTFRKTNAGFVAEIAVMIPRTTRVYFTALGQYRKSGSVRVAGWTKTLDSGASGTFGGPDVRMNHAFLGLGLGARF